MKRKKPKLPPSHHAWPCVIVAIDPGEDAGASIFAHGKLVASYQVKPGQEERILHAAAATSRTECLPLIVVREKWTGGGHRATPAMMAGLGIAWGRWDAALRHVDRAYKVHQVYPRTWQSKVISGRALKGEETIRVAKGLAVGAGIAEPGPDQAVSYCIGRWASYAAELGELLDLKVLDAFGFDTTARRAREAAKRAAAKARKEAREGAAA